jgi:hypothetical protein
MMRSGDLFASQYWISLAHQFEAAEAGEARKMK